MPRRSKTTTKRAGTKRKTTVKKAAPARKTAATRPPQKVDLYRTHAKEYVTPRDPALVDVGPALYLAYAGRGEPGGEAFQAGIGAMYAVAWTVKMARKAAGHDYRVCGLEGLWWVDGGGDCAAVPKSEWNWKLLIRVPRLVAEKDVAAAVAALVKKGKGREVESVRLETIDEGTCVQVLHVGPYDRVGETGERMMAFARSAGLEHRGAHHELYLSDPRRVAPERLKTIVRWPVAPARAG